MIDELLDGLPEGKDIIGEGENSNHDYPGLHPPHWTMVLKVIEVPYPWHLLCPPGQTTQMGPDVPDVEGDTEKKHA